MAKTSKLRSDKEILNKADQTIELLERARKMVPSAKLNAKIETVLEEMMRWRVRYYLATQKQK